MSSGRLAARNPDPVDPVHGRRMARGITMPQPKRGLGKGLGALIPTGPISPMPAAGNRAATAGMAVPITGAYLDEIPVSAIVANPRQPRQVFDEDSMAELAASIETVGLLQPVVVRQADRGRYEL